MSPQIVKETMFLYHAVMLGIFVAIVYDGVRIFRRIVNHNRLFISIEDLLFWVFCAWKVFYLLYEESSGVLRWFAILGIALGMFLYLLTVSRFVVHYVSKWLNKALQIIAKALHVLFGPFRFVGKKVACATGKTCQFTAKTATKSGHKLKKQLTAFGKMIKMVLCKH